MAEALTYALSPRQEVVERLMASSRYALPLALAEAALSLLVLLMDFIVKAALICLQTWYSAAVFLVLELPLGVTLRFFRIVTVVLLSCLIFFLNITPGGAMLIKSLGLNIVRQ